MLDLAQLQNLDVALTALSSGARKANEQGRETATDIQKPARSSQAAS